VAVTPTETATPTEANGEGATGPADWTDEAQAELKRIPFFVRGKARKNTETFAREKGITRIDVETLYEAKAHFGGR
jgi:light-independent protochlorophyllide reductase subunit B